MNFKNILIVYTIVPETNHSYDAAIEIAKKFDSNITLLMCMYEEPPTFAFFSTKKEKQKHNIHVDKSKDFLESLAKKIESENISVKTEFSISDAPTESIISFIEEHEDVDLLVIDSPQIDKIEEETHKDMIHKIYKAIRCPMLTLR